MGEEEPDPGDIERGEHSPITACDAKVGE